MNKSDLGTTFYGHLERRRHYYNTGHIFWMPRALEKLQVMTWKKER